MTRLELRFERSAADWPSAQRDWLQATVEAFFTRLAQAGIELDVLSQPPPLLCSPGLDVADFNAGEMQVRLSDATRGCWDQTVLLHLVAEHLIAQFGDPLADLEPLRVALADTLVAVGTGRFGVGSSQWVAARGISNIPAGEPARSLTDAGTVRRAVGRADRVHRVGEDDHMGVRPGRAIQPLAVEVSQLISRFLIDVRADRRFGPTFGATLSCTIENLCAWLVREGRERPHHDYSRWAYTAAGTAEFYLYAVASSLMEAGCDEDAVEDILAMRAGSHARLEWVHARMAQSAIFHHRQLRSK